MDSKNSQYYWMVMERIGLAFWIIAVMIVVILAILAK